MYLKTFEEGLGTGKENKSLSIAGGRDEIRSYACCSLWRY